MHDHEIVTTPEGVHQCQPMPSTAELDAFYERKYFQANDIYAKTYDEREVRFFRDAVRLKFELLKSSLDGPTPIGTALEVGVGEGWTMSALADLGIEVTGIDYSDFACSQHNPQVRDRLIVGQPDTVLEELRSTGHVYDVIWLDNVLEHSPRPASLLESLFDLTHSASRLVIEVPNDYSLLQRHLLDHGLVSRPFWEAVPEHLSYFGRESLKAFCSSHGWDCRGMMSDFPIDLFLLNEHSNYVEHPAVGKAAHWARVSFSEAFRGVPTEAMVRFWEASADIGLGRNLIGVFAPRSRSADLK